MNIVFVYFGKPFMEVRVQVPPVSIARVKLNAHNIKKDQNTIVNMQNNIFQLQTHLSR